MFQKIPDELEDGHSISSEYHTQLQGDVDSCHHAVKTTRRKYCVGNEKMDITESYESEKGIRKDVVQLVTSYE